MKPFLQRWMNKTKKVIRRPVVFLRARPLIRDQAEMLIPRIIFKTKIRGKRIIFKPGSNQREHLMRKLVKGMLPMEGKHFALKVGKRYSSGKYRWEKYYDLPSLRAVYSGKKDRRIKALLKRTKLTAEQLIQKCVEAEGELTESMSREAEDLRDLDYGDHQILVDFKKEKIVFIMIDF